MGKVAMPHVDHDNFAARREAHLAARRGQMKRLYDSHASTAAEYVALPEPPLVPTPWPHLNDFLGGGLRLRDAVSISSGNHYLASRLMGTFHSFLKSAGFNVAWTSCSNDKTTRDGLERWARQSVRNGAEVLFVDWFPNFADRFRQVDEEEALERGWRPGPSEYDQIANVTGSLRTIASEGFATLVLGACMEGRARGVADSQEVTKRLLRGDSSIEICCQTVMICWQEPGSDVPLGWLYDWPNAEIARGICPPIPLMAEM